jgi:hypothetical protein
MKRILEFLGTVFLGALGLGIPLGMIVVINRLIESGEPLTNQVGLIVAGIIVVGMLWMVGAVIKLFIED